MDSGLTTNLFGYNMRSELADAIMGTNIYAYLYDPIGNRQLANVNEDTNLYMANELNQYTNINAGAVEPVYDPDGNMTQLGPWAYDWDGENRLISVASNGVPVVQNQYDYMSRRIMKATATQTNTFLYDDWNLVREDLGAAAPSSRSYVWGLDLSQSLQGAGGVGGLLAILSPDSCLLLMTPMATSPIWLIPMEPWLPTMNTTPMATSSPNPATKQMPIRLGSVPSIGMGRPDSITMATDSIARSWDGGSLGIRLKMPKCNKVRIFVSLLATL